MKPEDWDDRVQMMAIIYRCLSREVAKDEPPKPFTFRLIHTA